MKPQHDPFQALGHIEVADRRLAYYRLRALQDDGIAEVSQLPYSIRVMLEAALRRLDGFAVTEDHVRHFAAWSPHGNQGAEVPFVPARVLLQDFTGVPSVVDMAAMRNAVQRLGGDPQRINPQVAADLVVDHSVQVDAFGASNAMEINTRLEFERNHERYAFLRWGARALQNFRVVPPASGIVHQVNLEYLAPVVHLREGDGETLVFPDSLVGTDSHTTMINGLGVLGWGVGGIEAEAVMLGQPLYMTLPQVVGFELHGNLPAGATATDLVLTITQRLRSHGVVGKFVEFFGEGLTYLALPDRATIANMAPEYGATTGFFPVDEETLRYLRASGRSPELVELVEAYCKAQGLFRTPDEVPRYSEVLELDIGTVEPSLAGPRRPQDRVPLRAAKRAFHDALGAVYSKAVAPDAEENPVYTRWAAEGGNAEQPAALHPERHDLYRHLRTPVDIPGFPDAHLTHGSVVIAAITSCTNTSNPSVMMGAGILAKKAVQRGLKVPPWVKTSLAPGSRVVTRYLQASGLSEALEALRFHVVGYGCTTCIGNSGPLPDPVGRAVKDNDLVVAAVLSGNRNFEGRINPLVKANYLASPPLVVAYALAGTMDIDLQREPLGKDRDGRPVYLRELWPSPSEIHEALSCMDPAMFREEYRHVFEGNEDWNRIPTLDSALYPWDAASTYIREPPFFLDLGPEAPAVAPIRGARVLALLGDSITTDHISPAGSIPKDSPAGRYLMEHGVAPADFNSYGARRGNHEVMLRGTFANIRLRNALAAGTEGGYTKHLPDGAVMTIYEAAMRYQADGVPLVVLAGKEYGTGSSRDWAAKGAYLLGVRAVLAESFERIHRANLVGMGVLPLQFDPGHGWRQMGLSGQDTYEIEVPESLSPGQRTAVTATGPGGKVQRFDVRARVDSPVEVRYYRNGGILHTVLRDMLR
jgi:aconitate hydratase A / 2-methylisocitrate dehydratase